MKVTKIFNEDIKKINLKTVDEIVDWKLVLKKSQYKPLKCVTLESAPLSIHKPESVKELVSLCKFINHNKFITSLYKTESTMTYSSYHIPVFTLKT